MSARFPLSALAVLAALATASATSAEYRSFSGEHAIRLNLNGQIQEVSATGTGVAIVNGAGSGPTLHTLELTQAFGQIDTTVTTVPSLGIDEVRFDGVRIQPANSGPGGNPGVFAPIFGGAPLTLNTLPGAGVIRICNLFGCPSSIAVDLGQTSGMVAFGPGVGGTFMVDGAGPSQLTVMANPWTIKTTTVSYRTINGGTGFLTDMGFVQGPMSGPSSTASAGGVVQLVSGTQTTSFGLDGNNDLAGQIARLTITFAPEPGMLVLFGAGAAGMALLGRRRSRR
jgi:hypothetical protein